MQYTVDYFIQKFEAIPEVKWYVGNFQDFLTGAKCALCHCQLEFSEENRKQTGSVYGAEYKALFDLMGESENDADGCFIATVNDGRHDNYQQPTPKQRILAALYDIKKMQQPKVKEVIRYVSVSASLKKQIELIDN